MAPDISPAPETTLSLSRRLVRLLRDRHRSGLPAGVAERARLHAMDSVAIALAARPSLAICRSPRGWCWG